MPPTGKLSTEPRKFKDIVADLRCAVFSVIRDRPNQAGAFSSLPLGTGFFVKPDVFITCHHVFNPALDPHKSGDSYRLIANLTGSSATVHTITNVEVGKNLTLFPNLDLAVLQFNVGPDQAYAAITYDDVGIGDDIGVVGYPLAALNLDANGNLLLEGLIYRAAKGTITGRYAGTLNPQAPDLPVLEVNFMFVSGNSGGPVFEASTGRVVGMVQGIRWNKLAEQVSQISTPNLQLPLALPTDYIACIHAIYSLGIKLDCFRSTLDGFGITCKSVRSLTPAMRPRIHHIRAWLAVALSAEGERS